MAPHLGSVKSKSKLSPNWPTVAKRGLAGNLFRVKEEIVRDPYNTAVASVLNDAYKRLNSPMTRLVQATGKSKNTVLRYLAGERDIRVVELRKLARALELSLGDVFTEADRRVE